MLIPRNNDLLEGAIGPVNKNMKIYICGRLPEANQAIGNVMIYPASGLDLAPTTFKELKKKNEKTDFELQNTDLSDFWKYLVGGSTYVEK